MKSRLNKKYLTNFSFLNDTRPNSISIWKSDIKFFIREAIRQGNCFTLYHDLNFFSLDDIWDEACFQNVCQWAYITFTDKQLEKELKKLRDINLDNLQFLYDTLSKNPHPYAKMSENSTDKTFVFCKQKLNYLSKNQNFKAVIQQDEKNRIIILEYLQKKINVTPDSNTKSNGPFTETLIGDPEKTKRVLQEEFEKVELDITN